MVGVKQILAISRLSEPLQAQVQLQVRIALDCSLKLLWPVFARVLVGFTIGDSVRKAQDAMHKKDDSSVCRWALIPTDEDASSIPAGPALIPTLLPSSQLLQTRSNLVQEWRISNSTSITF